MLSKIDLVIFDMDGVIIDSEYHYLAVQQQLMAKDGVEVSIEQLYPVVGLEWDAHFDYVASFYEGKKGRAEVRVDMYSYLETVRHDYKSWVFDDVVDSVKRLHNKGIKVALASNSDHRIMVDVLEQIGIDHYFSKINSAEFFKRGKPDPAIYLDTVSTLDVDKDRVLVIEDSESGITAAKEAGLKVFAIKDTRFNVNQSEASAIINKISDIFDK